MKKQVWAVTNENHEDITVQANSASDALAVLADHIKDSSLARDFSPARIVRVELIVNIDVGGCIASQ